MLNFWTEGLEKIWYRLDESYVAVKFIGLKPYSKKRIINFLKIFAQDCTAYSHLVELYRVLTPTVNYQRKNVFLLFIGYYYLGPNLA